MRYLPLLPLHVLVYSVLTWVGLAAEITAQLPPSNYLLEDPGTCLTDDLEKHDPGLHSEKRFVS